MLSVLEAAVSAADPTRITTVLESLSQVAAAQPRLFKGVLPVVVDGMGQLATSAALQLEARISCAELLLTLAEGAPKMCAKLEAFAPRVLSVLLPMLVRLGGDVAEWDAAEPEDGLFETDNDDDEEKEVPPSKRSDPPLTCRGAPRPEARSSPCQHASLSPAIPRPRPLLLLRATRLICPISCSTSSAARYPAGCLCGRGAR